MELEKRVSRVIAVVGGSNIMVFIEPGNHEYLKEFEEKHAVNFPVGTQFLSTEELEKEVIILENLHMDYFNSIKLLEMDCLAAEFIEMLKFPIRDMETVDYPTLAHHLINQKPSMFGLDNDEYIYMPLIIKPP